MARKLRALVALLAILIPAMSNAGDPRPALRSELDKGLARGLPSISIAVATRQGVIWTGAAGYADVPARSRAHPGYLYGIGSITKVFVACVMQQLIDEARLTLDTRAGEILGPESLAGIPNAERATVRQLLEHTSGIPTWEFDARWIRAGRGDHLDPERIWGKADTLNYLRDGHDAATNQPGLGYGYSNTNYTILGLIIEKITGADAAAEIRRRVLAPLSLDDIRMEGFESIPASRVPARYQFGTAEFVRDAGLHPSFRRLSPRLVDVSRSNLSAEWTAGGMLATAHDLALFARALRDGRVVSPAALSRMSSFRPTDDANEDMGEGLSIDRYGQEALIGYTGNVLGFGAAVGWVPGDDVVIAVMTNIGTMHEGRGAYDPEKLLRDTRIIALARELARDLAPRSASPGPSPP
jgi:D-alanyl-D-alanine carboxypeptidase